MPCSYTYSYRTNYDHVECRSNGNGWNYSYGACCNLSATRWLNALIWVALFMCLCVLCGMMGAR